MQHGLLPEEQFATDAPAHAVCIACMFRAIASATARSSSLGLNWTYSVPACAIGTWPGGR